MKSFTYYSALTGIVALIAASNGLSELAENQSESIRYLGEWTYIQYSLIAGLMLWLWKFGPNNQDIRAYKAMLITAVLVRVILLGTEPYTSNDVERYLFDGKVALMGFDPYRVSHDLPALAEQRAIWQPPAEHAAYPTLYPPAALALFALTASVGAEYAQITWQCLLTLMSLLTLYVGVLVLIHFNKLQHLALLAFSPILVLEAGIGLHLDTWLALITVTALFCWAKKYWWQMGAVLGIGVLIKFLPIMMLGPVLFSAPIKHSIRTIIALILTVSVGYFAAFRLDLLPYGSLGVFFEKWRFASPYFSLLEGVLSPIPLLFLTLVIAAVTGTIIVWKSFKHSNNNDVQISLMQLSLALPLLVSPVVFPWYTVCLIPLLALRPHSYLLLWTALLPLTYEVLGPFNLDGTWQPADWPIWLLATVIPLYFYTLFYSCSRRLTGLQTLISSEIKPYSDTHKKITGSRQTC